jgi:hypothetical protein
MGFFNHFKKNSAAKKGEQIADFIISLTGDKDFRELLTSTPKPMSLRLMVDHILVCSGAATFALALNLKGKPDDLKRVYGSMTDRLIFHLESMSDAGVHLNIKDIVVDDNEKAIFMRGGWNLNETTDIYTVFDVIGDYRMDKYSRAVGEGFFESVEESDGMRLTAKLMQETKKSCGEDGFPYVELKLIYTDCITNIIQACSNK